LADVARPELAGLTIETHAPDIAQAAGPDFVPRVRQRGKRIIRRNAIRQVAGPRIDVDPDDFSEQRFHVLAVVLWIAGSATIAETEIKITIRPEQQRSAIVIPVALRVFQEDALGCRVGLVRVSFGNPDFAQDTAARILLGIKNIEQSIRLEPRMKSHRQ